MSSEQDWMAWIGFFQVVNDRVCHRADEAQALAAHEFGDEMRIDPAQPLDDGAQEIHVQIARRGFEDALESARVDFSEHGGDAGRRLRGAGLAVDERHLAEEISRRDEAERFLLSAAAHFGNPHGAAHDEEETVAGFALVEDDVVGVEAQQIDIGADVRHQRGRDAGEEAVLRERLGFGGGFESGDHALCFFRKRAAR